MKLLNHLLNHLFLNIELNYKHQWQGVVLSLIKFMHGITNVIKQVWNVTDYM